MSFRGNQYSWQSNIENRLHVRSEYLTNGIPQDELQNLFLDILHTGVHGLCFSVYEDGQKPGDIITEDQVKRRMEIIAPHVKWVRSFSCTEGNEYIPKVAKAMGIKTLVGSWLSDNQAVNEKEVNGLLDLASQGLVDIAAVGNEVLYRGDMSKEALMANVRSVKEKIGDVPVGYVDAYYEFTNHPDLADLCDVILTNCYPFWEGCPFEYSLQHMKEMFHQAKAAANGKKVIITETGWPSQGDSLKASVPSKTAAQQYFINTQLWSIDEEIDVFYFSSFDESWKVRAEGAVGAYWGIWDKNENLKI